MRVRLMPVLLGAVLCGTMPSNYGRTATPQGRSAAESRDPALESAAMKLLDEYMAAWNSKDVTAWERTFHFPHYRLASGKMITALPFSTLAQSPAPGVIKSEYI